MYKPLADSTLMGMTKKEIVEQLRTAEHNYQAMKETVNQQAKNCIKLLAEERKHGYWKRTDRYWWECSVCGGKNWIDRLREADSCKTPYCPHCGAKMDGGEQP